MTQPTHDEMLAWIDDKLKQIEEASSVYGAPTGDGYRASLLANRAVLERHKERLSIFHNCGEEDCREMVARRILESIYTDIATPIRSVMG